CASTNSATWASIKELLLGRSLRRGAGRAAHHRGPRMRLHYREGHGRDDEQDEERRGQLVQECRRAARAERRLRSATAECAREIRPFPLLHEDDEDQKQADDDV